MGDPHNAEWLRAQLKEFVAEYTPLAQFDITTKEEHASGRGAGYEQCLGVIRAILEGVPYDEFVWDPQKHDVVPRPIEYRN